jgi:hypothetical protein
VLSRCLHPDPQEDLLHKTRCQAPVVEVVVVVVVVVVEVVVEVVVVVVIVVVVVVVVVAVGMVLCALQDGVPPHHPIC